jgi:hypothetical protein
METCGHKLPYVEVNLFTFGLICYFCPGGQKHQLPSLNEFLKSILKVLKLTLCLSNQIQNTVLAA